MTQLTRYQFSVASFAMPHGMLEVLFPYLVVVYLVESPERVGVAQMVLMLPGLFFMLIGGVVAERVNKRTMLVASPRPSPQWVAVGRLLPANSAKAAASYQ